MTRAAQAAERQPTIDRNINCAAHQNIIGEPNQNSVENRPRYASGGGQGASPGPPWEAFGESWTALETPWEALAGGPGFSLRVRPWKILEEGPTDVGDTRHLILIFL